MTADQLEIASRLARGWMFPICPPRALVFDGRMTTEQVLSAVRKMYARHANN